MRVGSQIKAVVRVGERLERTGDTRCRGPEQRGHPFALIHLLLDRRQEDGHDSAEGWLPPPNSSRWASSEDFVPYPEQA